MLSINQSRHSMTFRATVTNRYFPLQFIIQDSMQYYHGIYTYTYIYTYMYIFKINNNSGDPPSRLVSIRRAYNKWCLTTRDTRRLTRTRTPPILRVANVDEDKSLYLFLSLRTRQGKSLQADQRVFETEDSRNEKNRFDSRPVSDKRGHASKFDCCILP